MILVLLRFLHFIFTFVDTVKSELLTLTFQSDIVRIWAHIKLSSFYYKGNTFYYRERLNQLRLVSLVIAVYLPHQSNHTLSPQLASINLLKCIRNKRCFIFFTREWEKNNKKHFRSVKIGNSTLIYNNPVKLDNFQRES